MSLLRADDFARDWYGYVTNQAGHAGIVGLVLAAIGLLILPPLAIVPVVALAYGLIWEWAIQRGGMVWDSVEDTAHVAAGAGFLAAPFAYIPASMFWQAWITLAICLAAWLAVLAVGAVRRRVLEWREWGL